MSVLMRIFRFELIEDARKRVEDKCVMRNKYCGHKDVLRVHARLGGGNWETYKNEIENKKWFLGKDRNKSFL